MKPTILFLFNSSSYAPAPWVADGRFNVVSVDYDTTDHAEAHREPLEGVTQLSIDLSKTWSVEAVKLALMGLGMAMPSLVVSFAPCTDMAVSGAKHFASKLAADPECQNRAARMAQLASKFGCPYIVENPVSILSTLWRKSDVIVQPHRFSGFIGPEEQAHPDFPGLIPDGDRYRKTTCLWLGNGAMAPLVDSRDPLEEGNPGWAKLGGKSARTKYIRSLTPRGLSRAIYAANYQFILQKVVDKGFLTAKLAARTGH